MLQPLFIGTTELLLIGGMALLLFGGKKLPEMMRGLGQGVKEFKEGLNEVKAPEEDNAEDSDEETHGAGETAGTTGGRAGVAAPGVERKDAAHE